MKKIGIIVFIAALVVGTLFSSLFSFGKVSGRIFNFSIGRGVKGSGNAVAETRDAKGFKSVEVGGIFKVEIVAQKDFGVEVTADDNLLQHIRTEVDGDVLKISTQGRVNPSSPMIVRVSAPDIEHLDVSGVANVTVSGLKNAAFGVDTSGASKIELSGETDKLTIDVSGASKIEAENLKARAASVDASGASKITVFATESVRAEASGASKIFYAGGAADVVKSTSGASSVSAK
jgi:hypothetical protein